jgi:hypothetical protein
MSSDGRRYMRRFVPTVGAVTAALLVPAAADAAPARPLVNTGGPANVGQTTVVLNGWVNPREADTSYFFQYGTTRIYGATTPAAGAGAGKRRVRVAVAVGALAPFTRYHYRLVAQNARGMVFGRNRTFRTLRQPLGLSLAASPNPVRAGRASVLAGTLSGTGNAGRQVMLQANPFPYTQGFLAAGNAQVTDAAGNFSFPILSVPVNTQYRVVMPQRPEIASPIAVVGAAVKVTRHVRVRRGNRRGRIRFSGRVTPAVDGQQILVQKFRDNQWTTIGRTFARDAGASSSRYVKIVRPRRGGRFRVVANVQGAYVPSVSRNVRVRRVRR